MKLRALSATFSLLLCAFVALPGCSLILDFAAECTSNSDCGNGVCSDGVCENPTCESRSDCASFGDEYSCVYRQCVAIDEEMCSADPDLGDDSSEILHIGALFPFSGRNETKGEATYIGAKAALEQVNLASNGVRGVQLSMIRCDTENSPDRAAEVAAYLVDTVGVQSIVGSIASGETLAIAQNVTIDAGVVLMSPASTATSISDLEDDDLVWRTIASDALQGPALAWLVEKNDLEKVLLIRDEKSSYASGLYDSFLRSDIVGADRIESLGYQVEEGSGDLIADSIVGDATKLLVDDGFVPDAIVVLGSLESQQLIFALDENFFGDLADEEKPQWILSEAGRDPSLLDERFRDVWPRIRGTIIQTLETPEYADFKLRFEALSEFNVEDHPFADKGFDAAWILALAHGAYADPLATTGADVSDRLAFVSGGDTFAPGDPLKAALDELRDGAIDYQGASGPVDFIRSTGDVTSDIASWGIVTNDEGGATFQTRDVIYTADGETR